ncbi:MAG: transposase [Gammaproteobacteria bacterium]|nr:transposase [Gammaproteobacteria bacterium]
MARLPRLCLPGIPQHIIQRGNNRQACFASEEDFAAYAHWLIEYSQRYKVAIHAWVFMTNHVHLLVTPETETAISQMMQTLGRHYVRYFNYTYRRTGTLWEGRFKSCVINATEYLLVCQRYIELNPVRAGMVEAPQDYRWSSYHANGLGKSTQLWTPHAVYLNLGADTAERTHAYRALFRGHIDTETLQRVRQATQQGMVLGNERFRREIEQLTGRRTTALKRGPKPKPQEKKKEFLL